MTRGIGRSRSPTESVAPVDTPAHRGQSSFMGWYDVFSLFYDASLEKLYAPHRGPAVTELRLSPGDRVLDAPCGTGQSLPLLMDAVGPEGAVVGLDASSGMLRRARHRVDRAGWKQVRLHEGRVPGALDAAADGSAFDGILCALGLSALPADAFPALWDHLHPGGRFVAFDVFADHPNLQTKVVEWMAQAELTRPWWEGLEAVAQDFTKTPLPADPVQMGGQLMVVAGTKPGLQDLSPEQRARPAP